MNSLMIDIETMGTTSQAAIVSIGAVTFDPKNENNPMHYFYQNVDLKTCTDFGLKIEAETIGWWLQQSEEARGALMKPPWMPLDHALEALTMFYVENNCQEVWSFGFFDIMILENAYRTVMQHAPWTYRDVRELRTMGKIAFSSIEAEKLATAHVMPAIKHHALQDAFSEVKRWYIYDRRIRGIQESAESLEKSDQDPFGASLL